MPSCFSLSLSLWLQLLLSLVEAQKEFALKKHVGKFVLIPNHEDISSISSFQKEEEINLLTAPYSDVALEGLELTKSYFKNNPTIKPRNVTPCQISEVHIYILGISPHSLSPPVHRTDAALNMPVVSRGEHIILER